jgi:hypothetical protein
MTIQEIVLAATKGLEKATPEQKAECAQALDRWSQKILLERPCSKTIH